MNIQHTPGPWMVGINSNTGNAWEVYGRGGNLCVAPCGTGNEALANASLIAAAPDLLEALVGLERAAAWHIETQKNGVAMDERMLSDARAAIAKATGGAK